MTPNSRRRPELLAPAGDWDCLRAAAANGADAAYFGLEGFNARRRATNFQLAELPRVITYLHERNVKAYVTFNTLIFSDELPAAVKYSTAIADAGADAVIVQDLGLARLIRRLAPTLPVHASTQMTQTEAGGIDYLRELGVQRVILARELTLAEIERIARATPMELEVFVHGALCISYSGQCLASESLWGRSANRGLCAQACRLPYKLIVDGQAMELSEREYLLSAQDLAAYDRVADLVRLGVAGFKIEGRLKSAHYVAAATRMYRAAIDAAVQGGRFAAPPESEAELALSFSRGLGHGYLDGVNHGGLVHGRFPKKRGIRLGIVVGKTPRGIVVQLDQHADGDCRGLGGSGPVLRRGRRDKVATPASSRREAKGGDAPIKPGDGVVFDSGRPQQDEQGGRVYSVTPSGRGVELTFGQGDVNLAAIEEGAEVWKTDDPAVRRRLESSFKREVVARRVPLNVRVSASPGEALTVQVTDDRGRRVQVASAERLAQADRHPLTVELLCEQFGRLGNTPFELGSVELIGPAGPTDAVPVMAPKSVLNDLRRQAVQMLMEKRAAESRHAIVEPDALAVIRAEIANDGARPGAAEPQRLAEPRAAHSGDEPQPGPAVPHPQSETALLHVLVRDLAQLDAMLRWHPADSRVAGGIVYGEFANLADAERAVALGHEAGRPIGLAVPRVLMPGEEEMLDKLAALSPQTLLVRNLGGWQRLRTRHLDLPLIGDYSLNAANELTADILNGGMAASQRTSGLGGHALARITPSYDLNWPQLAAMLGWFPASRFEVVLHQHVPMFHMRYCLFAAQVGAKQICPECRPGTERTCVKHAVRLRDRNGVEHPARVDAAGRNTVYNAAAQSAAEFVSAMLESGLRHFRVELLDESPAQATALLDAYAALLAQAITPDEALRRVRATLGTTVVPGTWARE
jgi:U32 family peptidase